MINHDTLRTRLDGDTIINVRRLRINKRNRGKGKGSDLMTNTVKSGRYTIA